MNGGLFYARGGLGARNIYLVILVSVATLYNLGWAKNNKSAQNQLLAWAHMPMGIESSHTKFGVILFSQLVPASC